MDFLLQQQLRRQLPLQNPVPSTLLGNQASFTANSLMTLPGVLQHPRTRLRAVGTLTVGVLAIVYVTHWPADILIFKPK